jgi:hypothetical protein
MPQWVALHSYGHTLRVTIGFTGKVIFWKGPAPWFFVTVPPKQSKQIQSIAKQASYGWGCIPCDVTVGKTTTYTALIPKDGLYLVPLKAALRKAERIEHGGNVSLILDIHSHG